MKKNIARILVFVLCLSMCCTMMAACSNDREQIVIYTCANESRIAYMTEALQERFPDYDFIVEYQSTSKLAAKLMAEGTNTDCDIVHDLAYLNLASLSEAGYLADVSFINTDMFVDEVNVSNDYVIECRTSGGVIVNTDVMEARGLPYPESFEDLLDPVYKGLISMPDPKSSSTAYMFVKGLVNVWGEEKAFDYFEKLSENVLQFTSSGNGPVNALIQEEVAIGLGMTNNAVYQMDQGAPLEVIIFEEGVPYTMYGQTIMKGKEERACVVEVFKYLVEEYLIIEGDRDGAEKIMKDYDFTSENYPKNIVYCDMSGDSLEEKERLLEMWGNW